MMLDQETRALVSRLARIKPFALHETMVPAAGLSPEALSAVEGFLQAGRKELRMRAKSFLDWLGSEPGGRAPADEMQRRFTLVRLRFNDVISQFDLFSDAVTQRSEQENGIFLAGLDVAAADALMLDGGHFTPPPVVCYLDRGPGAAIRRARTRMPGGGENPAAIIRVPRERMVGHGIASSLVHEVGHQVAALLDLVPSLRAAMAARREREANASEAWNLWDRWISEIIADFWSISRIGVGSTLGLIGVVSLPRWFVFRINDDDPHPTPWIRVMLSATIGEALYPHPQWGELKRVWQELYPLKGEKGRRRTTIESLLDSMGQFVSFLVSHQPASLKGKSLGQVGKLQNRTPEALDALQQRWDNNARRMRNQSPMLVFAVLGQARSRGRITPEKEAQILQFLLTDWALRSTIETSAATVAGQRLPQLVSRKRGPTVLKSPAVQRV
jgi:hypothetical protein